VTDLGFYNCMLVLYLKVVNCGVSFGCMLVTECDI
jgi:hypothetical protein